MKNLIIKPLLLMFDNIKDRDSVTLGDLHQVENKVKKSIEKKLSIESQSHSIITDKMYLHIVEQLKPFFNDSKKIKKDILLSETNKIIRAENFYYVKNEHYAKDINTFSPIPESASVKKCYDLAFYNALSDNTRKDCHHEHASRRDVYYMRFEEFDEKVLIGNMQIDDKYPDRWGDKNKGAVMLTKKNIYASMVQEAIKHALEKNYGEILFQAGDAVHYSQWRVKNPYEYVELNNSNINFYQDLRTKGIEQFNSLKIGDYGLNARDPYTESVIFEKTDEYYKTHDSCYASDDLLVIADYIEKEIIEKRDMYFEETAQVPELLKALEYHFLSKEAGLALGTIDKIFHYLYININSRHNSEKIKYLNSLLKNSNEAINHESFNVKAAVNEFLTKFNYEALFLKKYPNILKIKKHKSIAKGPQYFYNFIDNVNVFNKRHIVPIKVGKIYKMYPDFNFICDFYPENNNTYRTSNWYDTVLTEILDKLHLQYKLKPIFTIPCSSYAKPGKIKAHAWQITDGLNEFAKRPMLVFSSHTKLKADSETIPQLELAADKFGVSPAKLKITNDFIIDENNQKRTGVYHSAFDEISLSRKNLSLLTHEGIHRLINKNLIPNREYKAMVNAGKSLVSRDDDLTSYINSTDKDGKLLYPTGPREK